MIQDDRELINRKDYYKEIIRALKAKGAVLSSTLSLKEILEIFESLPILEELGAEWIERGNMISCSWCTVSFPKTNRFRYCPSCGRRMR